eukprot:TRINITY_DN13697_c0_g1_i1.p1 TRINITY_DN13697_c0_g1~~TRINITY_DN13697_c0_g1_i1.p1  ORF type:complete len:130 (+),score=14.16 TRINITY_DN13697_c0_g1_i1:56-445(+)
MNFSFLGELGRTLMKRAQRGLYAGRSVRAGNSVSDSGRRTRRTWKPNVFTKTFWSDVMEKDLTFKVTGYANRWITKVGGIDNYIMNTSAKDMQSQLGLQYQRKMKRIVASKEARANSITEPVVSPPAPQ